MNVTQHKTIRFGLLGGAVFLVILGIFAFLSRDNLFRFFKDPRIPFQTYTPPPAPDYSDKNAWALAPVKTGKTSVFVVLPTVYWGGKDWNTATDAPAPLARLWDDAVSNWAGPFQNLGAVSAPLYRSASLYSFLTVRTDARGARALAYQDVLRAFDAFIAQTGGKGPIILAGSEQGGLHVLGLLQDRFNDPYLRERLAAAYVLNFAVPQDLFEGGLKGLSPCHNAESTRCIVTYGAFTQKQKAQIKRFAERSMVWDAEGQLHETKGRALACVNPILGGANTDFAPKRLHKGAVAAMGMEWGTSPAPIPAQTSAQCVEGILLIDSPKSRALRKKTGFGRRFKPEPFNLFYVDLAHDAKTRIQHLQTRFDQEGRLAPPFGNTLEILDSPIQMVPGN